MAEFLVALPIGITICALVIGVLKLVEARMDRRRLEEALEQRNADVVVMIGVLKLAAARMGRRQQEERERRDADRLWGDPR